jgi:heme/copper-type cytochrome/quinol oxidase subunit 2
MKRFGHAVIAVVGAYAFTYGVLVFIEYRVLAAHQQPEDHPKFPPEAAWVFAALHATMIFGVIAVIGVAVAVVFTIWEFFRSRRRRLSEQAASSHSHPSA